MGDLPRGPALAARAEPRLARPACRRPRGRAVRRARARAAHRGRADQRIATLGPDILGPEFGEAERARFLRRLREDDPTRPIGDALLDQRTIAGIGNLWKVEGCFAAGVDPWRPAGRVSDEEALRIVDWTRPRMQRSATDGKQTRFRVIYGQSGRPCPRCGAGPIRRRGQWDDNRPTYWCPSCQS